MQLLKFKYRLYPTPEQEQLLRQVIGANRFVWNYFLAAEMASYQFNKTFNFKYANCKTLTALKQGFEWLKTAPSTSLQYTLIYLDRALKDSFPQSKKKIIRGFPKFKKRRELNGSFSLTMIKLETHCDFNKNQFKVPNIGWIKTRFHRPLTEFKSCQVKQEAGYWHVVFTVTAQKQPKRLTANSVGIDINSKEIVLSDGRRFETPKYLLENQKEIKKLQKKLAKKTKGSNSKKKVQRKLAKLHYRIKMKRLNYFHQLSHYLVMNYDIICLEDLDVKEMQKRYGRMIQDNGFSLIRQLLEYKSELYGATTSIISRWFPSSKTCHQCGNIQDMSLATNKSRLYECRSCRLVMDRDLNAAININRAGTAQIHAGGVPQSLANQIMVGQLLGDDNIADKMAI